MFDIDEDVCRKSTILYFTPYAVDRQCLHINTKYKRNRELEREIEEERSFHGRMNEKRN